MVANAEPDGYTLLFGNVSTLAVIPAVTRNRDYDPVTNFIPVAKVSDSPELLVIDPALPVHSVSELIAYAKAQPGKLNYGSSGYGNATHLSAEWFKSKTGTDIVHVPYKGLSDTLMGLIGGQVAMAFGAVEGVLPLVQQGKLRPLAVTTANRFPLIPDLPTMIEGGVAGFMVTSFEGVVAPAGTAPRGCGATQCGHQRKRRVDGASGPVRATWNSTKHRHAPRIRRFFHCREPEMGCDCHRRPHRG